MKYQYDKTEYWPIYDLDDKPNDDYRGEFFVELTEEEYISYKFICKEFYRWQDKLGELAEKNRKPLDMEF
mgnify:CR=1 FL=1